MRLKKDIRNSCSSNISDSQTLLFLSLLQTLAVTGGCEHLMTQPGNAPKARLSHLTTSLSPAVLYQILQHLFSLLMQLQDDTMHGCFLLALCIGAVSMSDISVLLKEQFTQKWNSVNKYSPSCCSPHYISGASQQNSAAAFSETTEVLRDFFIHTLVVTNLSIKHHTLQFSSLLWLLCLEQVFQYHSN